MCVLVISILCDWVCGWYYTHGNTFFFYRCVQHIYNEQYTYLYTYTLTIHIQYTDYFMYTYRLYMDI